MNIDEKNCKYCGESIKLTAIKCKHCGEFLNDEVQFKNELPKSESNIKTPALFLVISLVIVVFGLVLTKTGRAELDKIASKLIKDRPLGK